MCGDDAPLSAYANRFGALAVLSTIGPSPPHPSPGSSISAEALPLPLPSTITFYNKGHPESRVATYMKFLPSDIPDLGSHGCLSVTIQ